MSARSRARRNKRRHIVPVWDLQVARYNHAWTVWAKKAKGMKGLYPVMINPRANGRIYRMRSMIESLGKSPFPVRGLNGDVLKGVMAHPTKIGKDGSVEDHIKIGNTMVSPYDAKEVSEFVRRHPPIVDPSLLGRKHGEFGGLCALPKRTEMEMAKDWEKSHYSKPPHQHTSIEPVAYASLLSPQRQQESKTPQSIIDALYGTDPRGLVEVTVPFEAKSLGGQVNAFAKQLLKNIDSIEGECNEVQPQTATALLQARVLREKEEERTLKDIAQLQSLIGADKPFDDFYLKAPISVYEIFEHHLTILPDGEWFPRPELYNVNIDQLKTPHKSGPFMLAVVSANQYEECRTNLENYGYVKIQTQHNQIQFVPGEPENITVKRYFLILLEHKLKPNDSHGFTIHARPSIPDLLMRTGYEEF